MAPQSDLERSIVWASHILIRHEAARNTNVSFSFVDWRSVADAPQRNRLSALALARQIAAELEREPGRFAELARQHSEDITTKEWGGDLGGIVASQLAVWPQVLDALAATPMGAVSQPVETEYGFHVFYRAHVPEADTVTGSRIVIGHDQAPWLRILARNGRPKRTREAALVLANELYERAVAAPGEFAALVAKYSEHRDAEQEGDLGSWSTREAALMPREIAALRRLKVGEVSRPIETVFGLQLIQRTPNRPRREYAMQGVRVLFDPDAELGDDHSQATVLRDLGQRALEISGDATRFAEAQRQVGSVGIEQWQEGRGTPAVQAALDQLDIGEIGREPILSEFSYVLVRRVAPTPVSAALLDLPKPAEFDLPALIAIMPTPDADAVLASSGRGAASTPELEVSLAQLRESWRVEFDRARTHQERVAVTLTLQQSVRDVMGEEKYATYLVALKHGVDALVASDGPEGSASAPGG